MINETQDKVMHLEMLRMHYEPYRYLRKYIKSTRDIYIKRNFLKTITFNEKSIAYLVGLIVCDLKNNVRFQRYECLKVIKRIIKNYIINNPFSESLIDNLFYLYQKYIFNGNDEIQWAVSIYIKNQPLNNNQIQWLINHSEESEHIVNRLLRYPFKNTLITDWATAVYKNNKLTDRLSEIIGILIDEDIPAFIKVSNNTLVWAIYYSKCSNAKKEELILKYMNYEDYSSSIEVADRLGLSSISRELLNYYKTLLKQTRLNSRKGA